MYGRLRSKRNKRERFCADSGTGIPIIPIEIVEEHELAWQQVDPDKPGCESASGHDMEIVGQTEFWVKFDNLKHPKLIQALVAKNAGSEILIDLNLLVEWTILPRDQSCKKLVSSVSWIKASFYSRLPEDNNQKCVNFFQYFL